MKKALFRLFLQVRSERVKFQIMRYQKRSDGTLRWIPEQGIFEGYGSNGRLHDVVWNERNWKN